MNKTKQILKNSSKSKVSVNKDILLDLDLNSSEKKFPSEGISTDIDQYKQYIKEKDASNKYRFVFTVNSLCTNVLYNHLSEIVQCSGDTVNFYGATKKTITRGSNAYIRYKYNANTEVNREELIRDTGYSHEKCGNFEYRCGLDIFNNHRFRNKEVVLVNGKKTSSSTCETYNTLKDELREYNGDTISMPVVASTSQVTAHLYYRDTTRSFEESIRDNLQEKDGWFGFTNPTALDINNFKQGSTECSINKVINNEPACAFIDLYPGRKEFSFIPYKNTRKNREEKNWDYCITYPAVSEYKNELVSLLSGSTTITVLVNGLLCDFCDSFGHKLEDTLENTNDTVIGKLLGNGNTDEFDDITIRTRVKNNITDSDSIKIHLAAETKDESGNTVIKYYTIKPNVKVRNIGIGGYNLAYYFTVSRSDIRSGLLSLVKLCGSTVNNVRCYVQRIVDNRPCKYYIRKFSRLPNFKNTSVNPENGLTPTDISNNIFNDFGSDINKLGFGVNIYGDRMAQIIFSDDIITTGLRDNLGRELHEVFLTIVKTNKGHTEWYTSKNYSSDNVEISHCFSDITSGFDLPWGYNVNNNESDIYNVHKLHNVASASTRVYLALPNPVKYLSSGITVNGDTDAFPEFDDIDNGAFFGDIVELDENNVIEYVLENVCHRFNTAQREDMTGEYSALTHDEIISDDYDGIFSAQTSNFSVQTFNFIPDNYSGANIALEGYYYNPHYNIKIREFSDTVNEGQHTIVNFSSITGGNSETHAGTTVQNYYFEVGKEIWAYNKKTKEKYVGVITNVSGSNFTSIEFKTSTVINLNTVTDFAFFKPNSEKPSTAYDFDDGSGIYKWRDIESFEFISNDSELYDSVFTNGAHYVHKNINFFLRRQDPYGIYGLNPSDNSNFPYEVQIMEQSGKETDITTAEYFPSDTIQLC